MDRQTVGLCAFATSTIGFICAGSVLTNKIVNKDVIAANPVAGRAVHTCAIMGAFVIGHGVGRALNQLIVGKEKTTQEETQTE